MDLDLIDNIKEINLVDIININTRKAALFAAGISDIDLLRIPFVSPIFQEPIYFKLINLNEEERLYMDSIKNKFKTNIPGGYFFKLRMNSYTNHGNVVNEFPKVTANIDLVFGNELIIGKHSGLLKKESKLK